MSDHWRFDLCDGDWVLTPKGKRRQVWGKPIFIRDDDDTGRLAIVLDSGTFWWVDELKPIEKETNK